MAITKWLIIFTRNLIDSAYKSTSIIRLRYKTHYRRYWKLGKNRFFSHMAIRKTLKTVSTMDFYESTRRMRNSQHTIAVKTSWCALVWNCTSTIFPHKAYPNINNSNCVAHSGCIILLCGVAFTRYGENRFDTFHMCGRLKWFVRWKKYHRIVAPNFPMLVLVVV